MGRFIFVSLIALSVWTADAGASEPGITFGPDGAVSSLVLETGGGNLVDERNPGRGFYLEGRENGSSVDLPLKQLERQGDKLVVSPSRDKPLPRFTFEVTSHPRYLALKLKRVEGLPANQPALNLEIRCRAAVVAQGLDYMIHAGVKWQVLQAHWKYLWHRNPGDPLGGVALYPAGDPDKEDEALLEVWVSEDLPKPAIKEPWTKERARQWLEDFARRYADQTRMIIAAQSPRELYAMTEVAERAGVKQVYLHTDTWRGEYWPVHQSHVHINPAVFPKGLDDLKGYAAHLRQRGMFLLLHTTSGCIGPHDSRRIAGHVDRGLATWGRGTLEEALDPAATTVRFRPAPGTALPGNIHGFIGYGTVRVDEELIKVGAFENTDCEVWTLSRCARGTGATQAADHAKGTEMAGLISAYGQVYMPDVDSPLMVEMAGEYAELANAIGLGRLEYDAAEVNCYPPWGFQKYSDLVARRLDHPVLSNTSSGRPVPANIELKFHRYAHLAPDHGRVETSFTTETGFRRATSEYEFNSALAGAIADGATKLELCKSQAMFGINEAMLAAHGLSGEFLADFRRWNEVSRLALGEQRQALRQALAEQSEGKKSLISHNFAQGKMGARIRETPDAYEVVPLRVLTRPTDAPAMRGVESGIAAPRQFVEPGQILDFNNPYAAQPLTWVIRVLPEMAFGSGATNRVSSEGQQAVVEQYLTGVAGVQPNAPAKAPGQNAPDKTPVRLQPKANEVRNQTYATYVQDGDGVVITADKARDQDFWKGDDLPNWARTVPMPGHGLSLDVTGDGSGAVLVIQLSGGGTRDYVVKIDFTGKRTIVIPSGEVSWADGRWGRRAGTERFGYDVVRGIAMGFGYVPAKVKPQVKVENLQLREDHPSRLVNPVIVVGAGEIQIAGEVESGQYLRYSGGNKAEVFDENWKPLRQLAVTVRDALMPAGRVLVSVRVADGTPRPWLETQFFTQGGPVRIPKDKAIKEGKVKE